ncbi:MAG: hypothetical protein IKN57_11450, partial [Parasporobacterium sp.]|nr:hypothetical protein [Parasporobacterium sp.]
NGSYVITITAISANTILRHSDLGLTVRQLLDVPDNVIIRVAPDIQIEDEPSGNRVAESSPATGNVITAAQISAMIESALAANPDATVLDIDLGNDPSLDADAVLALCDIKIAKRCHFTHNGIKFVLFVPVVDTDSASFKQCLALIDAEEGKQAGPIRLSYLFAPVKFSLSQE